MPRQLQIMGSIAHASRERHLTVEESHVVGNVASPRQKPVDFVAGEALAGQTRARASEDERKRALDKEVHHEQNDHVRRGRATDLLRTDQHACVPDGLLQLHLFRRLRSCRDGKARECLLSNDTHPCHHGWPFCRGRPFLRLICALFSLKVHFLQLGWWTVLGCVDWHSHIRLPCSIQQAGPQLTQLPLALLESSQKPLLALQVLRSPVLERLQPAQ